MQYILLNDDPRSFYKSVKISSNVSLVKPLLSLFLINNINNYSEIMVCRAFQKFV